MAESITIEEARVKYLDKKLLTLKETCEYLGIGDTKCRELLRGRNGFGVQIGNRWYANRQKLDKWIENLSK